MHHHNSKRSNFIKRLVVYSATTLLVVLIAGFVILTVMGFKFDTDRQQFEQYAFLQFNSAPTGASVAVNGVEVTGKTPNKTSVPEGKHEVVIWRDGFETWRKTLYIKSGTLTWLNYILMVPTKLSVESVADYEGLSTSLVSPLNKYIVVQQFVDKPSFDIAQLDMDLPTFNQIAIPKKDYSEAYTTSVKHAFKVASWDQGERYMLIKHNYNDNTEWLVADSQDENNTKNITKLFDLQFSDVKFSGTGGNTFFGLESGNIRKLDTKTGTVSKLLATKVKQFSLYSQNIITYIGDGDNGGRLVGLYRDGDEKPYVVKTISSSNVNRLQVASSRYFSEDYIAIADGKNVDILSGNYSTLLFSDLSSIKSVKTFDVAGDVLNLSFSPSGQYLLAQSGADFTSYDLEYKNTVLSTVDTTGSASPLKWLNNSYFWSDNGSNLNIREFDGANPRLINSVVVGQDVALTKSGKFLYSLDKSTNGYQLQRVKMTLL